MSDLCERVEQSIVGRGLLSLRQPILVAVSGGLDSMVLLHVLHRLAPRHRWSLTVAHLNHQLRGPSSDADERFVRRIAAKLDLPIVVERAPVNELARARKWSLEMAARERRHEFLARVAEQRHLRQVVLAHHADDQLELFFLRLLRGSGGQGLAGMKWQNPSPSNPRIRLVRPLLDQAKSSLAEYAAGTGVAFREDSTNSRLDIQRNRIRHELLPLLRQKYQPALNQIVTRVMEIVGAEAELISELAGLWLGHRLVAEISGDAPAASTALELPPETSFEKLPIAIQRRCLHLQMLSLGLAPEFELTERLRLRPDEPVCIGRDAVRKIPAIAPGAGANRVKTQPESVEFAESVTVFRDAEGAVHLKAPSTGGFRPETLEVSVREKAGKISFSGGELCWRLSTSGSTATYKPKGIGEVFDAHKVGSTIVLRHWRPGDRFHPIGMKNAIKLQDFFTNEKIPRQQRHQLVVAESAAGELFWVEGLRISERFKQAEATTRRLLWRWHRP